MRGQFGLKKHPVSSDGWYPASKGRSGSKVTYYYQDDDGVFHAGRTLASARQIPALYDRAWAKGNTDVEWPTDEEVQP